MRVRWFGMARIQVGGAGGDPSNNFIRSLRESRRGDYLIGTSSVPSDLFLADTEERHVVPYAADPEYPRAIPRLLQETRPDLLHSQIDLDGLFDHVLVSERRQGESARRGGSETLSRTCNPSTASGSETPSSTWRRPALSDALSGRSRTENAPNPTSCRSHQTSRARTWGPWTWKVASCSETGSQKFMYQ